MIYTAQCGDCGRVVAVSHDIGVVGGWLQRGLNVSMRDFDTAHPMHPRACQFCGPKPDTCDLSKQVKARGQDE